LKFIMLGMAGEEMIGTYLFQSTQVTDGKLVRNQKQNLRRKPSKRRYMSWFQ
jgi:hypothetical protein